MTKLRSYAECYDICSTFIVTETGDSEGTPVAILEACASALPVFLPDMQALKM